MDGLKIEMNEPFETPKMVKFKAKIGFKKFKKEIKAIRKDKEFEKTLIVDEVLDQDE